MEALFLVCGAGGPQLKRNPLGICPPTFPCRCSLIFPDGVPVAGSQLGSSRSGFDSHDDRGSRPGGPGSNPGGTPWQYFAPGRLHNYRCVKGRCLTCA